MNADTTQGSTIYGGRERAEAAWAALANGVAAHGLEMDDVENRSSLHPGVVVFPAVLALAEQLASSPTDIYAAVVAGYEITLQVGAALDPVSAYERGFHPTAVCGTLGAGCCSARLPQYHRIARRRGKHKAVWAVAHSIMMIIYHVLSTKQSYQDLGEDYFNRLEAPRLERHHVRQLEQLGYTVTLSPYVA